MIKRYCDQCGKEISVSAAEKRIKGTCKGMSFEVIVGKVGGATNEGDWCRACVFDAVASADGRPRADDPA